MNVLILGGGIMQLPAVRIAKGKGWKVFVAARDIDVAIRSLADEAIAVDLSDREAVGREAGRLRERFGLDGVFTAGTDFSTSVAWVADALRLPGIPYAVALNTTDKSRMRTRLRARGVPCPRFFTVRRRQPLERPEDFPFPLVVKPVDNMGARGVRRVDREGELTAAVNMALEQSRTGTAIVEEYMDGPELSLDAVVYRGQATVCGVADRHICFPPYFVEMGHTMPSSLDAELLAEAERVFKAGIRALGIRNGAAKGDIKITARGPAVGEIAARLSGGYMSGWTFPLSSGVEVTEAALNVAVGLPPGDLRPRYAAVSAERAFISIPGRILAVEGLPEVRQFAGVQELFLRVRVGDRVKLPVNNLEKCGNVITRSETRGKAVTAAERAIQQVFLRLAPSDPATESFLLGAEPGPWSAYPGLPRPFARKLAALPEAVGQPAWARRGPEGLAVLRPEGLGRERSRDWHGLELPAALERVLSLTGVTAVDAPHPGKLTLGRVFWRLLRRGGVQGAVYLLDTLLHGGEDPQQALLRFQKGAP
jgi:biotin carboxylase